jgi:hypothetical protein
MMAKRSKRGGSPVRVIEKSLSDAQKLVASYISSGSEQVTDTIRSLRRIFDNRQLAAALKKARAARLEVAGAISSRTGKKRKTSARRKTKARRGASTKRKVKAKRSGGRRKRA